jgi:mRNA interferase HigB
MVFAHETQLDLPQVCLHNAIMEIANRRALDKAARKNAALRKPIERWTEIVSEADWHNIDDVRKTFSSADGVPLSSGTVATVFNLAGNNYRIISVVFYETRRIYIAEVLTHAEYDKEHWKDRL